MTGGPLSSGGRCDSSYGYNLEVRLEDVLGFSAECFDSLQWVYFAADSFIFTHKGMWDEWKWYDSPNPPPVA
jgi:hypothetical protein